MTILLRSSSVPETSPTARAWMSALPIAVASTGPALTGRPVRSAVSWQSSALWEPPPTIAMRVGVRPVSAASWSTTPA